MPFWAIGFWVFEKVNQDNLDNNAVALVLGAGIVNNKLPTRVLKNRLDKGKELFKQGKVKFILVSGANQAVDYNEPKVMKDYLVAGGIPESKIFQDFGGRRTVDSCWRAKNVFKITDVIVVTQAFHIPKSVLACKQTGLDVNFAVAEDSGIDTTVMGMFREVPAIWVALFNSINYEPPIKADGTEPDLS